MCSLLRCVSPASKNDLLKTEFTNSRLEDESLPAWVASIFVIAVFFCLVSECNRLRALDVPQHLVSRDEPWILHCQVLGIVEVGKYSHDVRFEAPEVAEVGKSSHDDLVSQLVHARGRFGILRCLALEISEIGGQTCPSF